MEDKDLEYLFQDLKCEFDYDEPSAGHQTRFLNKLKNNGVVIIRKKTFNYRQLIAPLTAIAASLLLLFSIGLFTEKEPDLNGLASVSDEMAKTQSYFTLAINQELEKIEGQRRPETQILIDDAMMQLFILERDYKKLQKDLAISGDDERVIYAMIANFQNRVELLKSVLEHINQLNETKNLNNENTITI